jgi:uncharacterized protein YdiU (UPF0061 family)
MFHRPKKPSLDQSSPEQPGTLAMPKFESRYTRLLPADPETSNGRRQVSGSCYSRVLPTRVANPQLLAHSPEVAELLDLDAEFFKSSAFVETMGGNRLLEGMDPYATCYGGHQFGSWAGQLGDGRAINLGERINRRGERWVLQLKGAGPTPYSRSADGLAVLRSSVREFLCSEAMHHLGVPTTRALSLVSTGQEVMRDMFYDGHPKFEPGAVVCRVAPSFTRFGNFELFASRGEHALLKQFADYTIETDFPDFKAPARSTYVDWFAEICRRTADMVAHWMHVGFVHGVMNTDNMSVLGLTIDYGPYGWVDDFDTNWTPNTTDAQLRRYRFGAQPDIAVWNLAQLGSALSPLAGAPEPMQEALAEFSARFEESWQATMRAKMGLGKAALPGDGALISDLLDLLSSAETDMTIFFRSLADIDFDLLQQGDVGQASGKGVMPPVMAPLSKAYYSPDALPDDHVSRTVAWLQRYADRIRSEGTPHDVRRAGMNRVNPKYVLRNYLAQLAIDKAEQGDPSLVLELLDLLRRPYDDQPEMEQYASKRPDWARTRAGCSMLSCSS